MSIALISSLLFCVLALPLAIMVTTFAMQVFAYALWSEVEPQRPDADKARGAVAILVPAHNEASVIEASLASMTPQLRPGDRIVVVADNCTDNTAELCRLAGVDVVERQHATERGKGFALAHGVETLRLEPPEIVVIVDADCTLDPGSLDSLAHAVHVSGRPVQCLDLMVASRPELRQRVAEFAWRVRNWIRPAGAAHWGVPCQLMGTGMAFSWDMLASAALANASIVEDMKLGIELSLLGKPPLFITSARVTSRFPVADDAAATQRTRWEHGHLQMILREGPALAFAAVRARSWPLMGLALDLGVPPLALLAGSLAGLLLAGGLIALVFAQWGAAFLAGGLLALFSLSVVVAWRVQGRDLLRAGELLSMPWYVLRKLPVYLAFIYRRQREWVRTDRHPTDE